MRDRTIATRVPVEVARALEQMAAREDRTIAAELRRAIRRHVGMANGDTHAPRTVREAA